MRRFLRTMATLFPRIFHFQCECSSPQGNVLPTFFPPFADRKGKGPSIHGLRRERLWNFFLILGTERQPFANIVEPAAAAHPLVRPLLSYNLVGRSGLR